MCCGCVRLCVAVCGECSPIRTHRGLTTTTTSLQGTSWGLRMLFDNLFNIILLTVLLNIVFGIIIDTFASLREADKAKEEDMTNVCFICSIERSEFDRAQTSSFEQHIKEEHYWWSYMCACVCVCGKEAHDSPAELTPWPHLQTCSLISSSSLALS